MMLFIIAHRFNNFLFFVQKFNYITNETTVFQKIVFFFYSSLNIDHIILYIYEMIRRIIKRFRRGLTTREPPLAVRFRGYVVISFPRRPRIGETHDRQVVYRTYITVIND